MKKLFISLMLITTSLFVFAKTGPMVGEKDLKVVKTKWFDIIYPERCYKSASILYQNVDHIFEEVSDEYGLEQFGRMPIVITPAVEQLNAFFTTIPYNHIVLYDTSNDSIGELAVFSEDLLSIFRHELTHAVTYNMENGFWSVVTNIFGDTANIGQFVNITTGMAEGATVSEESSRGEGRLNSEYAKHSVKQAKIEDNFPSYYAIQGASDLNPYYFNGAFHEWLQNKYGMESYAKFWYYTVNVQGLTVAKRYKKAFGAVLKDDWAQFIQEYEVPDVPANPVEANIASDFFTPDAKNYSSKNNAGSRYHKLTSSENNLYWINYSNSTIYKTSKESLNAQEEENQSTKTKYKKILTQQGMYNISPSVDDKYLAISLYTNKSPTSRAYVKIYDTTTKQFYTVKESGLKDATIIKSDNEYYLVASQFKTPNNSIQVFNILTNKSGRIKGIEKINEKILPINVFAANYIPLGTNGTFAYIKKEKLTFSICIANLNGEVLSEYIAPEERMVINSLSGNQNEQTIHFSWSKKGTMPRDGFIKIEQSETDSYSKQADFYLSQDDISGGVYTPVCVDESVVYIGHFLNQNRMLVLEPDYNDYEKFDISADVEEEIVEQINIKEETLFTYENENFALPEAENFNSFNYYKRGIFIPTYLNVLQYISKVDGLEPCFYTLGATYITGNPWTSVADDIFLISGAYNAYYNRMDFDFLASFGTDTSLFNASTEITTEVDLARGWDYSTFNFTVGSGFNFGRISTVSLQNAFYSAIYRDFSYAMQDKVTFIYSNVHFMGPGTYEQGGIQIALGGFYSDQGILFGEEEDLLYTEDSSETESIELPYGYDLFASIYGYIPRLLPIDSEFGFTTNLPTIIGVNILPEERIVYPFEFARFSAETIVFGQLIKNPIPFIKGIFVQNWKISLGYQGSIGFGYENIYKKPHYLHIADYTKKVFDGDAFYEDNVYIKAGVTLSPNIGTFANRNFQSEIFVKYQLKLNRKDISTEVFKVDFGLDLQL